jgi:prepilin-type N-terminal cleavage/methylation domain-containing protein
MTAGAQAKVTRRGAGARAARAMRRRRGFTLIEVMAAMVLAAIVLPTAIQGTVLCMNLATNARMQVQAASLAQAKLSELAATKMIDDAVQTGDFGEQWPQYTWIATVQSWDDPRLVELDVSVLWNRRGKDYDVTVSTLVYDGVAGE